MRHTYLDHVQKMERELESAHRDFVKLYDEQQEKNAVYLYHALNFIYCFHLGKRKNEGRV